MCAIIGAVGTIPEEKTCIHARDTMLHRGPDDAGSYYNTQEGIFLGHRRLSIIDLSSAGHQPFISHDGRYILTFNGEIYNYVELRRELTGKYPFRTETDTEVLLAAYSVWGKACLAKLNGMFAFALWDTTTKQLMVARDRLGEKPFFYSVQQETLFFASEIKAIRAIGVPLQVNERIMYEYLSSGLYDHTSMTFFEGIHELPAGHIGIWKDGAFSIEHYWDLASVPLQHGLQQQDVQEQFRALLADAIRLRFRSDVPVGINLSSGLDSNSLLFYSHAIVGDNIETFSLCIPSDEYNECPIIGGFLGAKEKKHWHTATLEPTSVFSLAQTMNRIQDQPYGGIPTIAYTRLHEEAKRAGVTVLLEGQGLDELLAGYRYYRLEQEKDVKGIEQYGQGISSVDYSQDMSQLVDTTVLSSEFSVRNHGKGITFPEPFSSHLLNAQYRDLLHTKLPRVLRFNDHVSMAHSRELRLPYLDHRLVEFCFSLPPEFKIRGEEQKVLMRDAMKEYLPAVVQSRQKKAFGAVQTEWFRTLFQQEVRQILQSPSFRSRPYWNHEALEKKVQAFFAGTGTNSFFLWQCINVELWLREFIDPTPS